MTESRVMELLRVATEAKAVLKRAAEFLEKARLRERELGEGWNASGASFEQEELPNLDLLGLLRDGVGVFGGQAAVTTGLTGLAGTIGVASTGTAISSLSGAAATNAMLAWLGGGSLAVGGGGVAAGTMVLGGAATGTVTLGAGLAARKMAERFRIDVERTVARILIQMASMKRDQTWWRQVRSRMSELEQSLVQVTEQLTARLSDSDTADSAAVYRIYMLAKALGELLTAVNEELERLRSRPQGGAA